MGLKEAFIGDGERYDYGSMCMPNIPCITKEAKKLNFYSKGEQSRAM
jgi:hypothetical protein